MKLAAAFFAGVAAFILSARYGWLANAPEGIATIVFVCTLAGLYLLNDRQEKPLSRYLNRQFMPSSPLMRRRRLLHGIRGSIATISVCALCVAAVGVAYDQRHAIRSGATKFLSQLQPGRAVALAKGEAVLTRGSGGHFTAIVSINGRSFRMLVDTGSTDIALTYEDAMKLGINMENLRFEHPVTTANGATKVALITLSTVKVGPITLKDVRASVAQPGRLSGALLGMSFLGRLSEVTFAGRELRLKQ